MKTFTIECVALEALCEFNKLDIDTVFGQISNSDTCFGTNADTLLTRWYLEDILEHKLDWIWDDTVLISLGC